MTALPLYHVFALTVNCFVPLMVGANNLLIPNPRDIKGFRQGAAAHAVHGRSAASTPCSTRCSNDPDFLRLDFSRLHLAVAGGMAVQRAVAERWKQVTGKPLIEGYGLTETSPIATTNPLTIEDYTGAIGLPVPSTDIAIRDTDGRDVPLGEAGRALHQGSAGDGRLLEQARRDGQGDDRGRLSAHRRHRPRRRARLSSTIVDRQKDMIIVSGFNVYPNEIEDVVMTHPGVHEVGAVGVPDSKSGEAVKIVVVRKDDAADRRRDSSPTAASI